jgi:hypothetical protein
VVTAAPGRPAAPVAAGKRVRPGTRVAAVVVAAGKRARPGTRVAAAAVAVKPVRAAALAAARVVPAA